MANIHQNKADHRERPGSAPNACATDLDQTAQRRWHLQTIGVDVATLHPQTRQALEAILNVMPNCSSFTIEIDNGHGAGLATVIVTRRYMRRAAKRVDDPTARILANDPTITAMADEGRTVPVRSREVRSRASNGTCDDTEKRERERRRIKNAFKNDAMTITDAILALHKIER